jgi:glycerophosphoryl diester phosphodiesterase
MVERRFSEDLPTPLVVAHRGASRREPENTLPAFDAAVAVGADAVEFDVRMTADGHAVVLHDPDLDRTTDGTGPVHEVTLADLKRLRVRAAGGSGDGKPVEVPTLAETLELLSGRVAIDVEIKNLPGEPGFDPDEEVAVDATLHALEESAFVGAVLVSSFNPRSIARSRELAPDVPTGLLTIEHMPVADAVAMSAGSRHGWVLPAAAAVLRAGEPLVALAHDEGLRLGTWIVDDGPTARILADWGIDAIATNDPGTIVDALSAVR